MTRIVYYQTTNCIKVCNKIEVNDLSNRQNSINKNIRFIIPLLRSDFV